MNQDQTESKPEGVEEPRDEGLDETICSPSSLTPETDAAVETISLYRGDDLDIVDPDFARKLETSMRKLHAAYKQKVRGEMQLGRFDKEALTLLAEIQREHPSLSENTDSQTKV